MPHPLPLPEPLRGGETGTFAHHSVVVRLPDIARRTLAENDFPPPVVARLQSLIAEIPDAPLRPLTDSAPDAALWAEYLAPHAGQNWLQVPWFLAEFYFYRRVLEATGYFSPGAARHADPFARQKERGLETTVDAIAALCREVRRRLDAPTRREAALVALLKANLWGNRADLSLWPAGETKTAPAAEAESDARLLVDDSRRAARYLLRSAAPPRVDVLVDNAGFELVSDLALADFLLSTGIAAAVHFHLKPQPTFVSDALAKDVRQTVAFLARLPHADARDAGQRLQAHLSAGRLRLREHPFWVSPLPGWEMPPDLRDDLRASRLVIAKGDAHYRRLLGDRHWPFTTPFEDVTGYFPAPLVALRTLKSEVAAGLSPARIQTAQRKDPHWLTDGRWGVIQMTIDDWRLTIDE